MTKVIKVGIADLNIAKAPDKLRTSGLGSCVGITLYDPVKKVAGLAHIMLPTSEISKWKDQNQAKYADTAVPLLISLMEKEGCVLKRFIAKMAGGAQMFAFQTTSDSMRIGHRNAEACKALLTRYKIPLTVEEIGGSHGRTIEICAETGVLMIRTVNQGTIEV